MDQHIPNANAEKAIAEPTLNNGDDLHSTNGLVLEKEPTTKVAESPAGKEDESKYPQGFKLWMILTALYIAMFLVALDRLIIVNAIPKITDDFHSLDDIGWYGSAYLITGSSFMLLFGKIYTFYSTKMVFLSAIGLFEIGSAICGAAPNSTAFIVGRAIAGLGSSGIFGGAIVIMVHTIPLAKRPMYQGLFGAVFGIASVVGPLLGGAFTQYVSWRWCFYINLPIGGATIVALMFILKIPTPPGSAGLTIKQQFLRLDPVGTIVFLPGVACLLLVLQWGGVQYPWNSARVIVLLVLSGILHITFVIIQIHLKESATVPPRIIKQRSVAAGFFYTFCFGASMMVMVYFVPVWFQAIKNVTAVESGIRVLALVLALVVGSIINGWITYTIGYYTPAMYVSSVITSIGAGLVTKWHVDTNKQHWIGYQILYGVGLGFGMQQANVAVQTVLSKRDVPIGASLISLAQTLGGAIFISVGENIFTNKLKAGLFQIKGVDMSLVMNTGATEIRSVIPPQLLGAVLKVYNAALMDAIYISVAVSALSIVGAISTEWKSVKHGEGQGEKPKVEKDVPVA